jgi:hypothetical protein
MKSILAGAGQGWRLLPWLLFVSLCHSFYIPGELPVYGYTVLGLADFLLPQVTPLSATKTKNLFRY